MLKRNTVMKDLIWSAGPEEEDELLSDERWLLVQRVLLSTGFGRARQLRKILLYITRSAILHPDESLHEYEIACEVLGRRPEFTPRTTSSFAPKWVICGVSYKAFIWKKATPRSSA